MNSKKNRQSGTYWVLVAANAPGGVKWLACMYYADSKTWAFPGMGYLIPDNSMIVEYICDDPIPEPSCFLGTTGEISFKP